MTKKEITKLVDERYEAERSRPWSNNGSPRKARRRIREAIERELAAASK